MLDYLLPIAAGGLVFCLILLLYSGSQKKKDRIQERLTDLSREVTKAYLIGDDELSKPFSERVIRPVLQKISQHVMSFLPVRGQKQDSGEKQKKLLQQAGWTISLEEYLTVQLLMMIGCGFLGLAIAFLTSVSALDMMLYFLVGMFMAYTLMRYYCTAAVTKRKNAIEKQLPDMLDLLSVSVAAGLGFERAMLHIIETMDGPLIDEFAVSYREMSMGRTRKDALTLLGERCGVEDLSSVTSAIVQAGQLGIPMRNVLQSQAAAIRRSRRSKVQEKAAKVSTKILLPMVGLIFPVLFIVLLGPSLITIVEQFG